jgi:hypothetical protein
VVRDHPMREMPERWGWEYSIGSSLRPGWLENHHHARVTRSIPYEMSDCTIVKFWDRLRDTPIRNNDGRLNNSRMLKRCNSELGRRNPDSPNLSLSSRAYLQNHRRHPQLSGRCNGKGAADDEQSSAISPSLANPWYASPCKQSGESMKPRGENHFGKTGMRRRPG